MAVDTSDSPADFLSFPASRLAELIKAREISVKEVVASSLERAAIVQAEFNSFTRIFNDESIEAAERADKAIASGAELGPLFGVPISIKDFTPTEGQLTTRGSCTLETNVGAADPVIVKRLKAAGAIVVAKTTTPEFAYSSFTQSPLWGITRNPWNRDHTPGGSSGGAAVSVVTGSVGIAEGTDMGGSVRIPSAFSGCVGMKPSKGRIPMEITGSVFDHISHFGPLARSVHDAALFLRVTEGPDEADMQSQLQPLPIPETLMTNAKGLRIAISPDLGFYNVDPTVLSNLKRSADALVEAGAQVDWVDLDWPANFATEWVEYWEVFLAAQFGHLLETSRDIMDPELVHVLDAGMKAKAIDIERGALTRTLQWRKMAQLFEKYDALVCPTTAQVAPLAKQKDSDFESLGDDGRLNGLDMTAIFNNVGVCPAIAVPNWTADNALPTSVQVIGRRFDDPTVLRIASCLEHFSPWPLWKPAG
ncbi:MAG: amidase [Hyphomicrobiales bacterium]|uniref:amidase n=1 Tax=Shimia thalassica TaxID=1715693 RepID=UPI0032997E3F